MTGKGAAIFGCEGAILGASEAAFFRDFDPFGFILFARNVQDPEQLRRLTGSLRDAVGRDAPILVDQEGGRVQRLRAPHWREWTPPLDFVAAAKDPEAALRLRYAIIGAELRAVGIDADCAPVGDLITEATHPFLKNRCYGSDPAEVSRLGLAVAEGLMLGGCLPVMKHLPGHGRSTVDTHHELPTVTAPREEVIAHDFAPFRAWADLPMAMTAHLVFTAWDADHPATQSPAMIRAIRQEIGFDGLLMTDDLNMQALKGDLGQRTRASMAAGCDIALHCKGDLAEMQAVAAEAGEMTPDARARAERVIAARPKASVDIAAFEAKLLAMMPDAFHGPL